MSEGRAFLSGIDDYDKLVIFRSSLCKIGSVRSSGRGEITLRVPMENNHKENPMRRNVLILSGVLMASSLVLWGCSSSPSKDELKQLETTQAEITSLTQKESALKREKASLRQTIDNRKATLKTCQDDMTAVELKLKIGN